MKNLNQILKGFGNLDEWMSFLNEKINDGAEISRGKDPHDKSKEEKAMEAAPPGGDEMMADAGMDAAAGAAPPVIDPSQAPGSQIAIGKKKEKTFDAKAKEIKISGETQKLDMKPHVSVLTNGPY